ncbi:MAG: bifunctional riboflavin kinase/FAD synthetase [Alphaproteobacteria bacterium]
MPAASRGAVVAIGNFDGVHKGHRALIGEAAAIAKNLNAPLAALTFEPHPREFFQPQADPFRLTLPAQKTRLLEALGVRHLFALPFNAGLASQSPDEFIDLLQNKLGARHIVTGPDFAFGKARAGGVKQLQEAADKGLFGFTALAPVRCEGEEPYSSTRIRQLLQQGKFEAAAGLLGWNWAMETEVVHGDKRGRELGYPTANQQVQRYIRIPYGIYAVRVKIEDEAHWREGAANFGIRPMFRVEQPILETFIFDFSGDIYGKMMQVQPVAHLRPELEFKGLEALVEQMKQDCAEALTVLKSTRL